MAIKFIYTCKESAAVAFIQDVFVRICIIDLLQIRNVILQSGSFHRRYVLIQYHTSFALSFCQIRGIHHVHVEIRNVQEFPDRIDVWIIVQE